MSDTVAAAKLRAFIERVERIEADIADLNSDKSEVYKELRGEGYDVKTVRKIVAKRKLDSFEREEQDALFELYWDALHNGYSRVHVHEDDEQAAAKSAATNEPAATTDTAGDYLREPATVVSDQIIREGDAPRETDCQAGEASQGGSDASCPDTEFPLADLPQPSAPEGDSPPAQSSGAAIPDADVPAFLKPKKTAADYRPHCQRPDMCAASGLHHCYSCKKAMADSEAA